MYRSSRIQNNVEAAEKEEYPVPGSQKELVWWMSWEFYLIILLTIGLRFYRIDTAQYMTDHNTFYQMAHDAVANGLWPISANRSSTGSLIPPLFVYIMMLPAAITPNPVAGNILIALSNSAAVLLTYIFVRRYYGRPAGAIAGLLYATSANVIVFSRDIWQPDLLPLLMVLLLFMLFRGGVQKKSFWFLPVVVLIAAMYQLHSTAVYLVVSLLVTVVLAFRTIRWQELLLTVLGLVLLFAPYLYLEYRRQFVDILMLFHVVSRDAVFNGDVLQFYRVFVSSYVFNPLHQHSDTHLIPSNGHSVLLTTPLHFIAQFSLPESWLMEVLVVGGIVTLMMRVLWAGRSPEQRGLLIQLKDLVASPQRRGLILLLVWQGTALFFLRHSTFVYAHYLLYLIPGPFIIIGILLSSMVKQGHRLPFSWERGVRYGLYVMVGLIVVVQTVSSAGWLIDRTLGNFNSNYARPQYFDLATIQRIVDTSDRMAQQRHLKHVYVGIHGDDVNSVRYLSQFAHTSMEVVDSGQCLVLPSVQSGSVVYVTDSKRPDLDALLQRYTVAAQIGEIVYPGGTPFRVYIVRARPEPQPNLQLSGGVQLLSHQADLVSIGTTNQKMVVTRWRIQNTQSPQPLTIYKYSFLSPQGSFELDGNEQSCQLSRTWNGDEFIPLFKFNGYAPQYLTMGIEKFISSPQHYDYGSLKMVVFDTIDTPHVTLHMAHGEEVINLSVPSTNVLRREGTYEIGGVDPR